MTSTAPPPALVAAWFAGAGPLPYNTLVVLVGVAAVGFAAGVIGSLALLRKRPLVGDAAAHATLVGVGLAFLATGRRDLPTLLAGAFASALAALVALVLLRRFTRTRDDAATAIVIGVSFGAGLALVAGITARGLPGSAGLEQFLLGHTAALTARDAVVLAATSLLAVLVAALALKEALLVAFDADFAAACGWPVSLIDVGLVALVALMVVLGLPAAGAVLVTALVVIPPVAARQWTDRAGRMLVLAGAFGLIAAVAGVVVSTLRPGLATGPLVVLAAAAICLVSFAAAPERGWLARRWREAASARSWARGRVLEECLALAERDAAGAFDPRAVHARAGGDAPAVRREVRRAWNRLAGERVIEPAAGGIDDGGAGPSPGPAGARWRLTAAGRAEAGERQRRIAAWRAVLDSGVESGRDALTLELPAPEDALGAGLTTRAIAPTAAGRGR